MLFHVMQARRRVIVTYTLYINLLLALILPSVCGNQAAPSSQSNELSNDENDFAEFEDFDEEDANHGMGVPSGGKVNVKVPTGDSTPAGSVSPNDKSNSKQETDAVLEEEEDDDDDIFENIAQTDNKQGNGDSQPADGLKITRVPIHFRRNWDSYYVEILFIFGIVLYFINFFSGSSKNSTLANTWLDVNQDLLESNFALVGDDGKREIENHGLLKDTESVFLLWCSGRSSVEGMLIEIRLWKRQDLMSVITRLFKPVNDQVIFKLTLSQDSMDSYVFCLANKKSASRLLKESADLAVFCPERKNVEKFGINASKFVLMNEIGEVSSFFFDPRITSLIEKFEDAIDYIHLSDQYSGPRASDLDPQPLKLPEVKKILHVAFNRKSLARTFARFSLSLSLPLPRQCQQPNLPPVSRVSRRNDHWFKWFSTLWIK